MDCLKWTCNQNKGSRGREQRYLKILSWSEQNPSREVRPYNQWRILYMLIRNPCEDTPNLCQQWIDRCKHAYNDAYFHEAQKKKIIGRIFVAVRYFFYIQTTLSCSVVVYIHVFCIFEVDSASVLLFTEFLLTCGRIYAAVEQRNQFHSSA